MKFGMGVSPSNNIINNYAAGEATAAAFTPHGVEFDATNDYLTHTGSFTGAVDNKFMLVSAWIWTNSFAVQNTVLASGQNGHLQLRITNNGYIDLFAHSNPGVTACVTMEGNQSLSTGVWNHILMTADCASAANSTGYINETLMTYGSKAIANANIKWTGGHDHLIGAMFNFSSLMNGSLAEVYMTNEWLDLSVLDNRRKFITADGNPEDLGSDGSTPTGTQPLLYMKGEAADWNAGTANAGSGGTMTMTGAVVDSAHEPMDISP